MKKIILWLIKIYRNYLSQFMIGKCKYYPTCSEYTMQAIEKKGALKGLCLGVWRILRCNPFSRGGHDPVL